jgi:beta-ureidopropionase / N-carbamoyl-L-amino-acid hydrolase
MPAQTDDLVHDEDVAVAADFLDYLRENSLDPPGVSRASFGPGERMAHARLAEVARGLGLMLQTDFVGNLFVTQPGRDPSLPVVMIGSHLDAVPHGGNFDGAAGVAIGLGVLARLRRRGALPTRGVTLLAIRAEEMSWFPTHYIGSRAGFGLLPADSLENVFRSDSGRSLASHMAEEGFEPERIGKGEASLVAAQIHAYIEPHIEQGPVLVDAGIPVGIVTAIRGNLRYKHCSVRGTYGHAGAVPRVARRDAVMAATAFVQQIEAYWLAREAANADFVATVGQLFTDASQHTITKIPGKVHFTLDMRSDNNAVLMAAHAHLSLKAREIAETRDVSIDLGPYTHAQAASMDGGLRSRLRRLAVAHGIPAMELPSGGGHDCATFANQDVPSVMVFIRNDMGSHNPDEAMEIADMVQALRLVAALVDEIAF